MGTALGGNVLTINKLSAAGAFQDTYTFIWNNQKKGWYDGSGKIPVGDTDVTFENGEGMLVANGWSPKINNVATPTNVFFQASGEVDLYGKNMFPFGKSLAGNSLPRTIDLTEIKVLNENGEEFGTDMSTALGGNVVTINKLLGGAFGDTYTFIWNNQKKGWYDGSGKIPVKVGDMPLKPGEAFLLTNNWKKKGTDERIIYLKMPSPLDPMPVPAE